MAKPKFDTLFPTMVVGSLPRPRWVVDIIQQRTEGVLSWTEADRLLDDAVLGAIRMQERAGLDFVSDGEYRRENYVRVFADKVGGFRRARVERGPLKQLAFVEKPVERRGPIVADEAEFLLKNTERKTLVTLPAPCTLADLMWHPEHSAGAYPTKRGFIEACAPLLREEIIALGRLGVDAVQLDEPLLPRLANPAIYYTEPDTPQDVVALSVQAINQVTEGLDDIFVTVHLCHGHGEPESKVAEATNLMKMAVEEMRADRLAMEFNSPWARSMQSLKDFPDDKILGLGVVVPNDEEVESPQTVVRRAQAALPLVDAQRITINPDCGFATTAGRGELLDRAYMKLAAMCEGTKLLREKVAAK
jgi:5-methyltetrahydropteroyltriglutamate--homocysteine methyltransferase